MPGETMGAHAYEYFVPYEADLNAALDRLRQREFEAGRYNPAMPFLTFPIEEGSPAPGPQHDSIQEAVEDAGEDGTRSILDISLVDTRPDDGVAAPIPNAQLQELFGTAQPTRAMIQENMDFFEDIERGQCVYIIVYRDGVPSEIFFGGYSYD